jgi:hypothetical protein
MAIANEAVSTGVVVGDESFGSESAVSWAAIIAGAVADAAITLLLVALGCGIGLSSVSPWSSANPAATTFTLLAAVWLIIVQWLASATGGYLAGRRGRNGLACILMRSSFGTRPTAFLSWALASVLVAGLAASHHHGHQHRL